jgi:hypothetical protein
VPKYSTEHLLPFASLSQVVAILFPLRVVRALFHAALVILIAIQLFLLLVMSSSLEYLTEHAGKLSVVDDLGLRAAGRAAAERETVRVRFVQENSLVHVAACVAGACLVNVPF